MAPNASHPSRVRGLKRLFDLALLIWRGSHPSRVRGLKPRYYDQQLSESEVAPLAGAWIETLSRFVWSGTIVSHPSRVRGLKHLQRY